MFVTCQQRFNDADRTTCLMRSYDAPPARSPEHPWPVAGAQHADTLTAWQAARATSAGQSYFPSLRLGTVEWDDGGFGANNPAELAYREAQALHQFDPALHYVVVSIGTAEALPTGKQASILHELTSRITGVREVHGTMQAMSQAFGRLSYHRLQPRRLGAA